MYEIYVIKRNGEGRTYSLIQTLSFSGSRILCTFRDGSMIRFHPADVIEIKVASNVRRVSDGDI